MTSIRNAPSPSRQPSAIGAPVGGIFSAFEVGLDSAGYRPRPLKRILATVFFDVGGKRGLG